MATAILSCLILAGSTLTVSEALLLRLVTQAPIITGKGGIGLSPFSFEKGGTPGWIS